MNNSSQPKPTVAAFDFDKTITTCDTFLPFLFHCVGYLKTGLCLAWNTPALIGSLFSKSPRQQAKEIILSHLFQGLPLSEFEEISRSFADSDLKKFIRPEALRRIQWHLNQGHRCVLVSASVENYILPWAKKSGFQDLLASRLETSPSNTITGRFFGNNCRGIEKVKRLEELLGPRSGYILYAYGDSNGDKEMLEMADFAFYRHLP